MTELIAHARARVSPDIVLRGTGRVEIEEFAEIQDRVLLDTGTGGLIQIRARAKLKLGVVVKAYGGQLVIGKRTTIGEYSMIACHGGITIGEQCMFGPYVFLNAADHIISAEDPYRFQGETTRGIVVGDGVWLGARVTILDGVEVGSAAVVGAHSLITKDIPAGVLAVGAPARTVKVL